VSYPPISEADRAGYEKNPLTKDKFRFVEVDAPKEPIAAPAGGLTKSGTADKAADIANAAPPPPPPAK
jgi:hypothetical protein